MGHSGLILAVILAVVAAVESESEAASNATSGSTEKQKYQDGADFTNNLASDVSP